MKTNRAANFEGRSERSIHIGGVFASSQPTVVRTVLGSCIAVCLRDPSVKVGGMNHFMLPEAAEGEDGSARYGVHAMELLINECMKAGADRRRMEAKVFGGGHVLRIKDTENSVPKRNIRFVLEFLQVESIPIVSRDIGGLVTRKVLFFTDSGRALLQKIGRRDGALELAAEKTRREELASLREMSRPAAPPDDSNITLF
jgi:chemotaxis protein CheD